MRISVIGLGKLGACSAACFAAKGYEVIGVDLNKKYTDDINAGKAPVHEPRLQELITSAGGRLRATQDYEAAIKGSDVTFLIVPTPSREDGNFSNDYLLDALDKLSAALNISGKTYHLFVITSTVSPGATDEVLVPLIERVSGRKLNVGFGVCYNPEFIALGSVITNFLNPDMLLIGESSAYAGGVLEEIYGKVCENTPYFARMSIVSAEITKISLNSYVTMKISYANTLANICEKIPGADVDDISRALGADKRISPYYLKGGLGYGGPCFPRDNRAFAVFAAKYGVDAKLAKATDEVNGYQVKHLVDLVLEHISTAHDTVVSVLGLAYKPDTPVIEESPGIKLVEELLKRNLKVMVYDELASDTAKAMFGDLVMYATSVRECVSKASVCIVTTMTDEFRKIEGSYIAHDPTVVIDCWRILEPSRLGTKAKYISVGRFDYEHCTACS